MISIYLGFNESQPKKFIKSVLWPTKYFTNNLNEDFDP